MGEKVPESQSNRPIFGVGTATLFVLLFTGLKLGGKIDWSWIWVFAPWWGFFGLFCAGIFLVFFFALIAYFINFVVEFFQKKIRR